MYNQKLLSSSELSLKELVDAIKSAASYQSTKKFKIVFKKPWFNFLCYNARSRANKCLVQLRRQNQPHPELIQKYNTLRQNFKRLCKLRKIEFEQETITKINSVNSSSEWWSLVKRLKAHPVTRLGEISCNELRDYFNELLNPTTSSKSIQYAAPEIKDEHLDA